MQREKPEKIHEQRHAIILEHIYAFQYFWFKRIYILMVDRVLNELTLKFGGK